MESILEFLFMNDWGRYIVSGLATSGFISHAVAISPTKKDDAAVGVLRSVINILGGNYLNAKNKEK